MKAINPPGLNQEYLKEHLYYNPVTGIFTWLHDRKPSNMVKSGLRAGFSRKDTKYRLIGLLGRQIFEQRLAWLYMTGELPELQVDHINGRKDDNRWINLRLATNSENQFNRGTSKRNISGVKGVYWHKRDKKWCVCIRTRGGSRVYGRFIDFDSACKFAKDSIQKFHGEFANHSSKKARNENIKT